VRLDIHSPWFSFCRGLLCFVDIVCESESSVYKGIVAFLSFLLPALPPASLIRGLILRVPSVLRRVCICIFNFFFAETIARHQVSISVFSFRPIKVLMNSSQSGPSFSPNILSILRNYTSCIDRRRRRRHRRWWWWWWPEKVIPRSLSIFRLILDTNL